MICLLFIASLFLWPSLIFPVCILLCPLASPQFGFLFWSCVLTVLFLFSLRYTHTRWPSWNSLHFSLPHLTFSSRFWHWLFRFHHSWFCWCRPRCIVSRGCSDHLEEDIGKENGGEGRTIIETQQQPFVVSSSLSSSTSSASLSFSSSFPSSFSSSSSSSCSANFSSSSSSSSFSLDFDFSDLTVTREDMAAALKRIKPSGLREVCQGQRES